MRPLRLILPIALCVGVPAAAERAQVIRAGDLMDQPFIDAAKAGPIAAAQGVTVLKRQGGWVQVTADGGRTGWVRALNLRLAAGAGPAPVVRGGPKLALQGGTPPSPFGAAGMKGKRSNLTTGSSGKTVSTGVKGLDEENIRNASFDEEQLDKLNALGVSADDARTMAAADKLAENKVDYLKKGKSK